jgi:starch synthase
MDDTALRVLFVSAEVAPFAKTGGLADVAGSLPKALSILGNDIRIVMPKYKQIQVGDYVTDFPVSMSGRQETAIIRKASIFAKNHGIEKYVPVYLVDNYHYFNRPGIYGYADEAERYAFFCKAVLNMLPKIGFQPDIIHCNDWQSGPIPLLLKTIYAEDPFYNSISTLFTIHNLQYQGNFPKEVLSHLDLGQELYHPEAAEFYGYVSFIKTGLVYSDIINTVSTQYAEEIKTPERGEHMDGILRKRSKDLYGIVNGINYHEFNPETDQRIFSNYNAQSMEKKKENKYALQKEMDLPVKDVPILGFISRLVNQKGLDIVADAINDLMQLNLQFIILGTGEEYYENLVKEVKQKHPDKVGLYLGFNPILAQRIYAGSDMFLMPSRFEPCGLGQLISMRYGTIPIVRATGGLVDTVHDYNETTESGNGFSFKKYSGQELYKTVARALKIYREHPDKWDKLVCHTMQIDHSWAKSGAEYHQLYITAINKRMTGDSSVAALG